MNLIEAVARTVTRPLSRSIALVPMADWGDMFSLDGLPQLHTTMQPNRESDVTGEYMSLVAGAYRGNGVAFACMMARLMLFSEARFQFQQMRGGRPGNLFGTPELAILDHPEPGKTTGDFLARALLDADLDGNWFGVRRPGGRIKRLRPDFVTVIVGSTSSDMSAWDPDAEVIGFVYEPRGPYASTVKPRVFLPDEVAHFAPIPDPTFQYRGMSWLLPILREMMADSAATTHKLAYFRNAATPNIAITLPSTMTTEKAREWIALFDQDHRGVFNAYKSMYFGGGATAEVIGSNFQQMDFRNMQSAVETRIASVSGMHPVVVPFSEGLTGSSLNAGNFQQAARMVADKTLRPLWRNFSGSLESIIPPPNGGARMWYDDRDVAFLRTDVKDQAEIVQTYGSTINALVDTGWEPTSAIDAVMSGDMNRLVHTGLLSVQLQAPGTQLAARGDFWPSDGPLARLGLVARDTVLPYDHPVVRAFPAMFEPTDLPAPVVVTTVPPPQLAPVRAQPQPDGKFRCPACSKLIGRSFGPGSDFDCPRCKAPISIPAAEREEDEPRNDMLSVVAALASRPVLAEGAVQVSLHPASFRMEAGAVHMDAPPPAQVNVTIPERAVDVHVAAAEPSIVNVTNEPAVVNVTTPEVRVDVQPPDVNVTVEAPEPTVVNVTNEPAVVNVEPAVVNVTTPEVVVHQGVTEVDARTTIHEPDQRDLVEHDTFVAAVQNLREMMAAPRNKKIVRDKDGRIVGVQDE